MRKNMDAPSSYAIRRTPSLKWYGQHAMEKSELPFDAPKILRSGDLNPVSDRDRPAEGFRRAFRDPKYALASANSAAGNESLGDALFWMDDLWKFHPTGNKNNKRR